MRKFLVVLLILSVMGGAFAQQNNWGKITGEAELNTTMDFARETFDKAEMFGGIGGKLVVTWNKEWDNAELGKWSINLPIRASNGFFGTDYADNPNNIEDSKANVKYVLNNLTVTVPFWFTVGSGARYNTAKDDGLIVTETNSGGNTILGIPLDSKGNADVNAIWAEDNWGFKAGVANLYLNPTLSHAGGYFHFMEGRSQLYVSRDSYNFKNDGSSGDYDVYKTEWWRASSYVLNPSFTTRDAFGAYFTGNDYINTSGVNEGLFKHLAHQQYAFHWENINENGIAYRFYLIPDTLNIGLAFVSSGKGAATDNLLSLGNNEILSGDNTAPFFPKTPDDKGAAVAGGKPDFNLIDDFFRHPVLGVKYDNKKLGVSAMVGLEPWDLAPDNTDVYIHAGAYFQLFESLKINGDISARFSTGTDDTTLGYGPDSLDPNFNFGVELTYTNDLPLFAGFGFKMLDLINKDYTMFGTDFIVGFGGAVRDGGYKFKDWNDGKDVDFGDSGTGPIIALRGHVNGLLGRSDSFKTTALDNKNIFNIGFDFMAGWKNFVLIGAPSGLKAPELTLTIGANLGLDFWFGSENVAKASEEGNHMKTSFLVYPIIDWQVWNNGKISFAYVLGSSDITRAKDIAPRNTTLDTNYLKTTFKWTL